MRKPDFLIVGAMKAGTTTLVNLLRQSSDIFIPKDELHYFDQKYDESINTYLNEFSKNGFQIVGEKTPTYSYDPNVPERIAEVLPDIKLIWIFRNPVDRAYSNYWHAYKKGGEIEPFEKVIQEDDERYQENIFKAYLKRSKYVEQVQRYLRYFSREQMYFLLFENLKNNQEEELNRLANFLNISPFEVNKLPKSNKTYLPKNIYIENLARRLFGKSIFWKIIHRLNQKSKSGYPELEKDIREKLNKYFGPYNSELEEITGLNLEAWNKS